MSFDVSWLDLREGADHAARDPELMLGFVEAVGATAHIADLGSGTGSTLRAFAAIGATDVQWTLVDWDEGLLREALHRQPKAQTLRADLASEIETILGAPFSGVTCSALIDLVSEEWIARFVEALRGRPCYAALSYDGIDHWEPEHSSDKTVRDAFNRDMQRDKGFGVAVGAKGAQMLSEHLSRAGYQVRTAPSPWQLQHPEDAPLIEKLAEGISQAAANAGCEMPTIEAWFAARRSAKSCTVGHIDLLAVKRDH